MHTLQRSTLQVARRLIASALIILPLDPESTTIDQLIHHIDSVTEKPSRYRGVVETLDDYSAFDPTY